MLREFSVLSCLGIAYQNSHAFQPIPVLSFLPGTAVSAAEGGCSTMAMPPPSFLRRTISSVRMGSRWQKMGGSGGLQFDDEEQEEEAGGAPGRPRQSGCTRCRGAGCGAEKWLHSELDYL